MDLFRRRILLHKFLPISVFLSLLFGCEARPDHNRPRAHQGVLDLRDWDFRKDGPVDLAGEYEFYWQRHLRPVDFAAPPLPKMSGYIEVHQVWNGYELNGEKLPGIGYATYRLKVLLNDSQESLALKFLDMGTAYRVFANGEKILEVGRPGVEASETRPNYRPQIVELPPTSREVELIYQVSNFHHRRGGAWEAIKLGTLEQIHTLRVRRLIFDFFLFGSIVIMGIYHLAIFALRKTDRSALYFAVFCFLVAVRMLTTVERFLLYFVPDLSWTWFVRIEYISYYLALPVFALFMYSIYGKQLHRQVLHVLLASGAFASALVLVTPVRIFSYTLPWYQVLTLMAIAYGLCYLIRGVIQKWEGAVIFLIGFLCLTATIINDMLDANAIIQTGHFVHFGLFVFIFSQAFLLSFRFSKAFKLVDTQREQLSETNANLRKEMAERSRAEREKRDLQQKLARSQKMEAIGLLAGGVAHDLNNILSGIVTYPDMLLLDLPAESSLRDPLRTIRESGLRAAAVVQDLLTLARRNVLNFEVLNLNELVTDYLRSAEYRQLKLDHPSIDIVTRLDRNVLNTKGSHIHLRKTLMNLILNAAEAQPLGGQITIATANRYIDRPTKGYEIIDEGTYAVLSVEDTGTGIEPEDLEKIFEPFYTKKVMGRSGSGLGMAVVWGTVHDHNGFIDVETTVGEGTRFELFFPVTEAEILFEEKTTPVENYRGHNERILVVDDVADQRQIAARILGRLGYRVASVASGEEAVEYIKYNEIDLVVLDMIMDPGIDGLETYKRMLEIRPGMRAIIASGFSETERVKQAQKLGAGSYLKKPYTIESLGLAVHAELQKVRV